MDFRNSEVVKRFSSKFKEKLLNYVEAMYSQKSDLNKIHDLDERKELACIRCGLKSSDVQRLIDMEDDDFSEVIFYYHTANSSLKFMGLCTDHQLYWRIQKTINSPIPEGADVENVLKKRADLSTISRDLAARIDMVHSEIFATKDVAEYAERAIREMLTPEKRLKMNGSVPQD